MKYLLNFLLNGKRQGVFKAPGVPNIGDKVLLRGASETLYVVNGVQWEFYDANASDLQHVEIELRK